MKRAHSMSGPPRRVSYDEFVDSEKLSSKSDVEMAPIRENLPSNDRAPFFWRTEGLTSDEAHSTLSSELKALLNNKVDRKKLVFRALYRRVLNISTLGQLLVVVLLCTCLINESSSSLDGRLLAEAFVVFVLFVIVNVIRMREYVLERVELTNRMGVYVNDFIGSISSSSFGEAETEVHDSQLALSRSISLFSVKRDGEWKRVPGNLLVTGDVVELSRGDIAPCPLLCLDSQHQGFILKTGRSSPFSLNTDPLWLREQVLRDTGSTQKREKLDKGTVKSSGRIFRVEKSPAIAQMSSILAAPERPPGPLDRYLRLLHQLSRNALVCFMVVITIMCCARYQIASPGPYPKDFYFALLLRIAYMSICLLPISLPLILLFANALGSSRLLALFETLQESSLIDDEPIDGFNMFDDDLESRPEKLISDQVKWRRVWTMTLAILAGRGQSLARSSNLVQSIGGTTVLAAVDKEGILAETTLAVEKILLPKQHGGSVVLDLRHDSSSENKIKFEDRGWKEHMAALKPIGLNCLLNGNYDSLAQCLSREERPTKFDRNMTTFETLTHLAREIGFNDNIVDDFTPIKEILTVAPKELGKQVDNICDDNERRASVSSTLSDDDDDDIVPHPDRDVSYSWYRGLPYMVSVALEDRRDNSLQLLSKGHPGHVMSKCTDYWDGEQIQPLTDAKREELLKMYYKWNHHFDQHCLAFAYSPLAPSEESLVRTPHSGPVFIVERSNENLEKGADDVNMVSASPVFPPATRDEGTSQSMPSSLMPRSISEPELPKAPEFNVTTNEQRPVSCATTPAEVGASETNSEAQVLETESLAASEGNTDVDSTSSAPKKQSSASAGIQAAPKPQIQRRTLSEESVGSNPVMLPVKKGESRLDFHESMRKLQKGQIFLGYAALRARTKPEILPFINTLQSSGIRFCFFSCENERKTRAFGTKLGLHCDWNCCLSLEAVKQKKKRDEFEYNHEALPSGIAAIRQHLQDDIDNVPLLVQMFANASSTTIRDTIELFQEYNENVWVMGNSRNMGNGLVFAQANISAAMDTTPDSVRHSQSYRNRAHFLASAKRKKVRTVPKLKTPAELGPALTSLPCALLLGKKTKIGMIYELVLEGRRLFYNAKQCITFAWMAHLELFLITLVSGLLFTPQVLTGTQIIWTQLIIIPLLSLPLISTAAHEGLRNEHMPKSKEYTDVSRMIVYFIVRFLPTAILVVLLFVALLVETSTTISWADAFSGTLDSDRVSDAAVEDDLVTARLFAHPFLVLYLCVQSANFHHRTKSIFDVKPYKNRYWMLGVALAVFIEVLYSLIYLGFTGMHVPAFPWYIPVIALLWPVVILGVDFLVKRDDAKKYARYQRRLRLQFETRLGMHSPEINRNLQPENS